MSLHAPLPGVLLTESLVAGGASADCLVLLLKEEKECKNDPNITWLQWRLFNGAGDTTPFRMDWKPSPPKPPASTTSRRKEVSMRPKSGSCLEEPEPKICWSCGCSPCWTFRPSSRTHRWWVMIRPAPLPLLPASLITALPLLPPPLIVYYPPSPLRTTYPTPVPSLLSPCVPP